jgi:hypothetical protein
MRSLKPLLSKNSISKTLKILRATLCHKLVCEFLALSVLTYS